MSFGEALRDNKTAPISWAVWSFRRWRESPQGDRPPSLVWVFSTKRLTAQANYFERELDILCATRYEVIPEHRDLIERWMRMTQDLLCKFPKERTQVKLVVDEYFPDSTYEDMCVAVRHKVSTLQSIVDADVKSFRLPRSDRDARTAKHQLTIF